MRKSNNYFQRQRIGLATIGGIMTLMVAFSLTPTFAGVVATITNSVNTASTGTLVMEEKTKTVQLHVPLLAPAVRHARLSTNTAAKHLFQEAAQVRP